MQTFDALDHIFWKTKAHHFTFGSVQKNNKLRIKKKKNNNYNKKCKASFHQKSIYLIKFLVKKYGNIFKCH